MDRNREARKSNMAASVNGLSRRRPRSNSLRDSPEEDGPMELQEAARLRDRVVKKDRDRDRFSRTKRRRGDRVNGGEESSEESVNDDEEEDYDDERGGGGGGAVRMFPPPNPTASVVSTSLSNHHYVHRKSFPPSATAKVIRPTPPGWKPADEMIGFSVPRKARSASGKRSQECSISSSGVGAEQINRQTSISPARLTASPAPASPPSSSNASVRKKMKPNGSKPRPPKSTSKPSSSNPEELEIEIAEVLYGMMTQSQNPSKKEIPASEAGNFDCREMNNSRASSPISNNTTQLPPNSSSSATPISAVAAPKRKRPRQVSDNLGSFIRHSSICSTTVTKIEVDLPPKTEFSSPNMGSGAENGTGPLDSACSQVSQPLSETLPPDSGRPEIGGEYRDVGQAKEETVASPKKESPMVRTDDYRDVAAVIKADSAISEIEIQREEKFEIDLMAPPPQTRSEREGEINSAASVEQKPAAKEKQEEKPVKPGKEEAIIVEPEQIKAKVTPEEAEIDKKPVVNKERNIDLQLDWGKVERDVSLSGNKLNPQLKSQQQQQPQPKVIKDEPLHTEKIAQTNSLPLPMSVASWPGGLPPMGRYIAPLQGVVSVDGSAVPPSTMQPLFSHPRPKRCATHCYIAQNIHYLQQFMKMNTFWPPAAGSTASLFGVKPNGLPSTELHGSNAGKILNPVQENGQGQSIFSGHSGKDKGSQATDIADAQRKQQQILLQQTLPPGAPTNMLGPAFIFPLNQQQAAAAAASVRPGSAKPPTASANVASTNASTTSVGASATRPPANTAVTFNYPHMPSGEPQYLAILQNKPYPFPIPSVGAQQPYRGTHAQAMPFFNGSFYSSQMVHPSQLQQPQQPSTQQQNTSSGSSSSQKHLHSQQQQQQRPQSSSGNNLHSFPASKRANQHTPTAEVGGEESPSTADSRVSRPPMNVYGQNFGQNFAAVPMHPQNFALMATPPLALSGTVSGGGNQGEKKQQGLKAAGVESINPQTFAMSFGSMNGVEMSSVAQNHALLQNLPEVARHTYLAAAHAAQQKKNFRVSEEGKTVAGGSDSSKNVGEEKKSSTGKPPSTVGQQSIVFSRPDIQDSISAPTLRGPRPSTPNAMASPTSLPNAQLQAQLQFHQHQQFHQQQMMQLHKHQQQQQQLAAASAGGNMTPAMSSGSVYNDHLASSVKFPNGMSHFQQNIVQNNSSSPAQPPQWKNSTKTTTSQVTSSLLASSLLAPSTKSLPQQQTRTDHNQTQISFGATHKSTAAPPHGQQAPSSHQVQSPPGRVGSPTTSSISKGAGGSPRTTTSTSASNKSAQPSSLSSQPPKSSVSVPSRKSSPVGGRNVPSILGKSHITSISNTSAKSQLQQQQQQQLFFSHGYIPAQGPHSTAPNSAAAAASITSGFYLQRRRSEQPQQSQQPTQASSVTSSSTGMLSLSSPATGMLSLSSPATASIASTSVAKAVAASTTGGFYSQRRRSEQPPQSQQPPHGLSATPSSTAMLSLCSPITVSNASTSDAKAGAASSPSGTYLQRRRLEQVQQSQQPRQNSSAASSSNGMLSLTSPVTVSNASTSGPKAVPAATNMKGAGYSSQGILHSTVPPGFSYVHAVPSPVQVKPADQKQPAEGKRDGLTRK